jgi:hypothetical protein
MTREEVQRLKPGDVVRWNDPDTDRRGIHLTIKTVEPEEDDAFMLDTGEVGQWICFPDELTPSSATDRRLQLEIALDAVKIHQDEFWEALSHLERLLGGVELDGNQDYGGCDVDTLLNMEVKEDDSEDEDDDDE